MAFSLLPGENVRLEIDADVSGGRIFFTPKLSLRVTNFRLVSTESLTRGSETTKYLPLEHIIYMQEGTYSSSRLRLAAIVLIVLGFIATVTVVGAIVGIPAIMVGVICGILYFLKRTQTLIVQTGADPVILSMRGKGSEIERIITEIELARLERTASDYGAAPQNALGGPSRPTQGFTGTLQERT